MLQCLALHLPKGTGLTEDGKWLSLSELALFVPLQFLLLCQMLEMVGELLYSILSTHFTQFDKHLTQQQRLQVETEGELGVFCKLCIQLCLQLLPSIPRTGGHGATLHSSKDIHWALTDY